MTEDQRHRWKLNSSADINEARKYEDEVFIQWGSWRERGIEREGESNTFFFDV